MADLVLQAIVYVNFSEEKEEFYYFCFKIKLFYNFCFIYFFENIQFRLNGIKLNVYLFPS